MIITFDFIIILLLLLHVFTVLRTYQYYCNFCPIFFFFTETLNNRKKAPPPVLNSVIQLKCLCIHTWLLSFNSNYFNSNYHNVILYCLTD